MRYAIALSLIALLLISAVAVADHRSKQAQIRRAEVSAWRCAHFGTQCDAADPRQIESAWNAREHGYVAAMIAFSLIAAGSRLVSVRQARHRVRLEQHS
jgi:hypothetical protein